MTTEQMDEMDDRRTSEYVLRDGLGNVIGRPVGVTIPSSLRDRDALYDASGMTDEQIKRADALAEWWLAKAKAEIAEMVPKAIRYGSADLKVMGEAMVELHPALRGVVDGQELAVWFYVQGKVARLVGGYAQGELPDVDSWWDLKVYAGMAQHIRETGGW